VYTEVYNGLIEVTVDKEEDFPITLKLSEDFGDVVLGELPLSVEEVKEMIRALNRTLKTVESLKEGKI
jgi:hypothetical protein